EHHEQYPQPPPLPELERWAGGRASELSLDRRHHVYPLAPRVRLFGGAVGQLLAPSGGLVAGAELGSRTVRTRAGASAGPTTTGPRLHSPFRPRRAVCLDGLRGGAGAGRGPN